MSIQEISVDAIPRPNTSEAECRRNTSPEVIFPLILGYLQTVTGLDWTVRVKVLEVGDSGPILNVKLEVNMAVDKALFGSEPHPMFSPPIATTEN